MVWTVSVRDTDELEKKIRKGEDFEIPEECKHNSEVIYQILQHADKVLPRFKSLSDKEVRTMADIVAYLLRPDFFTCREYEFIGPNPLPEQTTFRTVNMADEKDFKIRLKNNPDALTPEFDLPLDKYPGMGGEFFRCYTAPLSWMPKMYDKLDPEHHSLVPAFKLADLTAFLLDPRDLTDYRYTEKEIYKFHKTLERENEEI